MMDEKTNGPLVDTALRTSRDGIFAAGNLLHPVDTADVAALDGRHVVEPVRNYLNGASAASGCVRILVEPPLRWISPGIVRPGDCAPARRRLLSWSETLVPFPKVVVHQDGKLVGQKRVPWPASPGRVFRIPWSVLDSADPHGGAVTISLS
jgi:hypothetical protein